MRDEISNLAQSFKGLLKYHDRILKRKIINQTTFDNERKMNANNT